MLAVATALQCIEEANLNKAILRSDSHSLAIAISFMWVPANRGLKGTEEQIY